MPLRMRSGIFFVQDAKCSIDDTVFIIYNSINIDF